MNVMDINTLLVASLPIVYMLHDFEEIIMMKSWAKSNEKRYSWIVTDFVPLLQFK